MRSLERINGDIRRLAARGEAMISLSQELKNLVSRLASTDDHEVIAAAFAIDELLGAWLDDATRH
jgi:hypothetical protein